MLYINTSSERRQHIFVCALKYVKREVQFGGDKTIFREAHLLLDTWPP